MDNITELQQSEWRRDVAMLLLLCVFAFFMGLGSRSLFSQDVVRYAEVAREVIHFDSWLIPRFNDSVYVNKPAPYIWLIAAPSVLIGEVNELTARLPSALAAFGAVIVTYFLGRRIAGRYAGMYSAICLVACYKFNLFARTSRADMPFAFFIIAGVYFLYAGIQTPSKRGRYYVFAFVMGAFSVLMKGPAGIIVMAIVLLVYAIVKKDRSLLKEWSLLWGFLIFLAIIAVWLVPTCIIGGPEVAKDLLVKQNISRFSGDIDHVEPFYYYFYKLPAEIAPLNLLIPLAIAFYISRRSRTRRDMTYVLVFIAVTFLFFQLNRSRNIRYLLPLYPGIAVLFGIFWDDFISERDRMNRATTWIFHITAAIVGLLMVSSIVGMPLVLALKGQSVIFGVLMSISLAGILVIVLTKFRESGRLMLFTGFFSVSIIAYVFLVIEMDSLEGVPEQVSFSRELIAATDGDEILLYKYFRPEYGHSRPAEFFYTGRYTPVINTREKLDRAMTLGMKERLHLLTLESVFDSELATEDGFEILLKKDYMDESLVLVRMAP